MAVMTTSVRKLSTFCPKSAITGRKAGADSGKLEQKMDVEEKKVTLRSSKQREVRKILMILWKSDAPDK